MSKTELGDVVRIDGRLAECIIISPETVTFDFIGSEPCPSCGNPDRATFVEGSLNWQNQVRSVSTPAIARSDGP